MKKYLYLLLLPLILSCSDQKDIEISIPSTPDELKLHTAEFQKEVIEVTDGVHMAVGFALANSMMIEGDGSNIIIDTTGSIETAREVKEIFQSINPNPISAIIYTHNHADHIYGASVFA